MNIFAGSLKKSLVALVAVVLGVVATNSAQAQVLLQVTVDPITGIATISSTGNLLTIASQVGPYLISDGVDLNGFFINNEGSSPFASVSGLTAATSSDSSLKFDQTAADSDTESLNQTALAMWNNDGTNTLTFVPNQIAFSGSLTLNLAGAAIGTGGNIWAGSPNAPGSPEIKLGQWEVVTAPEPSTWVLLLASVALLPLLRRFRRA